ncbi:MAG: hypothetical protein ACRDVL_11390 [Acidimicrobiia bacterium]
MELEGKFLQRVGEWESMSRWERSELGRELRRLGLSYGEIMELIPVKKSTPATWCRDVKLTEDQIEAIKERRAPEPGIPRNTNWRRLEEIDQLREIASDLLPELIEDPLWIAGLILYWAEGSKGRNHVSMANTDPRALRLFIQWIRTFVKPSARFSLALHLHEGNDEAAARRFWQAETGLYEANFYTTFIKPKGTGHRKNHLEHGVCTVRMRKPADAWNIVMEWIDALSVEFGLDAPAH